LANVDYPHGLNAVMSRMHDPPRLTKYRAFVNTTTPVGIYRGDVVILLSTGDIKTVAAATGDANVLGVANNYVEAVKANDGADVWVYDDPDTIYEVQSDGTTDPTLAGSRAHIGQSANLVITGGSAASGQSQQ